MLAAFGLLLSAPALPQMGHRGAVVASSLSDLSHADLQDGDLVFRRGIDLVASAVLAADSEARFSHVGIFLRLDGKAVIVHAVPAESGHDGGVIAEPIEAFLAPAMAEDMAAYRLEGLDKAAAARMRNYAIAAVGKPFDFALSMADDSELYCTELAIKSFVHAGIDLQPGLPTIRTIMMREPAVSPDALRRSPRLVEVRD